MVKTPQRTLFTTILISALGGTATAVSATPIIYFNDTPDEGSLESPLAPRASAEGLVIDDSKAQVRLVAATLTDTVREQDGAKLHFLTSTTPSSLMLIDIPQLHPGTVTELLTGMNFLDNTLGFDLAGHHYQLQRTAQQQDDCDSRVVLQEGSHQQVLFDVKQYLQQHPEPGCDEPSFAIYWAGDLDHDGKLDLITNFSPKYSYVPMQLWLSSAAPKGELLKPVAQYDSYSQ
ncbi:hypothetical protein QCD60_20165 [Pokkaliibacter sp. MBI-7]|uniref:hypothetical protein n=1 Tax=Pokkaliibacter sp. MBI-7 TaxID=3040600 RepID=UPI00244AD8EC|nr:hypothetical protein [Pokkaliibacter sp. MBI-7]MDH2434861.1 hypothetical protein [Pokkaliibacter sp. MBI-7]